MRIAIFGYEKLAVDIADYLNKPRNDLIIVDNKEENIREAAKQGFETVLADYSHDQELREIGIGTDIETIFCLLPDDAENVFLVISVRSIDARVPIVSIADAQDSIPKFLAAGADKVIDPYEISGLKIWRMIRKPIVSQVIEKTLMSKLDLHLAQVTIEKGSFLDGRELAESSLRQQYDLVLLGLVDCNFGDEFIFRTRGLRHRLGAGDILVVIGPYSDIDRLRRDLRAPE
ncbi:MAG TPA: NAD-binding protein [Gammaproteobacteria bacterium]|nr:NAD-binding protein [Gammaproteobacteria bacterium]